MGRVAYDDRCFLIDGRPIWLVSGSVHYFRIPPALWADRLLKAKRAGLNCISTYVPWNFHEPKEGQWNFEGERDVAGFVRLAGQLGLYVILRPGPYIGGQWDFGGLPGWLTAKSGMAYRTSNAAYTHYYDKYLANLLPRLAELQVSRGGNIICIQNENEYYFTTMPERLNYLQFISRLFGRSGFDIPIITCNLLSEPPVPEAIECINTSDQGIQQAKRLHLRQPAAPLLVTEFHCGRFDTWGQDHRRREPKEVARRALELLGCGAQINYHMWHGGTNFGFWAGRAGTSEAAYVTTSYDFDAPLAEGGGLTEKYYDTKLVNLLANHMGPYLAECLMDEPGVDVHDRTNVLNTYGPAGRWAVVTNNGREDVTSARLSLPEGQELTVSLQPLGAVAVPVELRLTPTITLDYANLMPLGFFAEKFLLLHGPADWAGQLSVNGKACRCTVPQGDRLEIFEHEGLSIVLLNSALARRTWVLDDSIVFGPSYVGADLDEIAHPPGVKEFAILSLEEGKLSQKKVKSGGAEGTLAPRLSPWKRLAVCTEPVSQELRWESINGPRSVDQLGIHLGYAWYRLTVKQPRAGRRHLFLPNCADRAKLYLNGELIGTWGRGADATREPIPADFKRGTNVLALLADNLGRTCVGPHFGEAKGLFGHLYDAKPVRGLIFKTKPAAGFAKRIIPRQFSHEIPRLQSLPLWEVHASLTRTKVLPIHLSFADMPWDVALICNDRPVSFLPRFGLSYGDVTLGAELKKGKNDLRLLLWGDQPAAKDLAKHLKMHVLEDCLSEKATWAYRPWQMPTPGGPVVGKDQPAWYVAKFRYTPSREALFLHIAGAKKGQLFLNGHNLGRFWTIGPQQRYYLPEAYLTEQNELLLFEEQGNIPRRSRLEFCPEGPYQS